MRDPSLVPSETRFQPLRVVLYGRNSFDLLARAVGRSRLNVDATVDYGESGSSVLSQLHILRKDCELNGYLVVAEYADNNTSASKKKVVNPDGTISFVGKQRNDFEQMLSDLDTGVVIADAIFGFETPRLHRNAQDKRRLDELCERRGMFLLTRDGVDTRTTGGRIAWGVQSEIAISKQEELRAFSAAYHLRRIESGMHWSEGFGHRYAGQRIGAHGRICSEYLVIDEIEAEIIRWCRDQILIENVGLSTLCRQLNNPSDPHYSPTPGQRNPRRARKDSSTGEPVNGKTVWVPLTLKQVLTTARIAGCTEFPRYDYKHPEMALQTTFYRDHAWAEAHGGQQRIPEIVSVDDLRQLRVRIGAAGEAARQRARHNGHYLLTSTVSCSHCGRHLVRNNKHNYNYRGQGEKNLLSSMTPMFTCQLDRSGACKTAELRAAGKKRVWVHEELLEKLVALRTIEFVRSGALARVIAQAASGEEIRTLSLEIAKDEQYLLEQFALMADMGVSHDKQREALEPHTDKLKKLKSRYDELVRRRLPADVGIPDDLVERIQYYWASKPLSWKRGLVHICWQDIIVFPDPEGRQGRIVHPGDTKQLERLAARVTFLPRV